jgi:arylsulfatase A-like enzyme
MLKKTGKLKERFELKHVLLAAIFISSSLISYSIAPNLDLSPNTAVDKPENIILIDIDTLRADHLGAYGYSKDTSPNLDKFAQENIKFENTVTPAAWTTPAAVSVFTGSYPKTHRVIRQRQQIPENYHMMAEIFRKNGYRTAAFTGDRSMARNLGFDQGFDTYQTYSDYPLIQKRNFKANFREGGDWLINQSGEKSFLFIHGYDAHAPYGVKEDYLAEFDNDNYSGPIEKYQPVRPDQLEYSSGNLTLNVGNKEIPLDQEDIEQIRAGYDSDVKYTDKQFGEFIDRLKKNGLYEDSAIIVYSSHGENLGNRVYREKDREYIFGHWYLWDHNIHVPMIAHIPGSESQNVDQPVSIIDIAPTLYDFIGAEMSKPAANQLRGESLLPVIKGEKDTDYVFSQDNPLNDTMVRGQNWKLIKRQGKKNLLYSLENSSEKQVSTEDNPMVYRRLLNRINEWENTTPDSMKEERNISRSKEESIYSKLNSFTEVIALGKDKKLEEILEDELISISNSKLKVEEDRKGSTAGKKARLIKASGKDSDIKVRILSNISTEFAQEYIKNERNSVISVYGGIAPYTSKPGAEKCGEEFHPGTREINSSSMKGTVIDLYADESKAYGACSDNAFYRSKIILGYCQSSRKLFKMNTYQPINSSQNRIYPSCIDKQIRE